MKKVKIKCISINNIGLSCYHVIIYNSKCEKILDSCINELGYVEFMPEFLEIYKIYVTNKNKTIVLNYLECKNNCNNIMVRFDDSNKHLITINLVDSNYDDLKIIKGKILLSAK